MGLLSTLGTLDGPSVVIVGHFNKSAP